ncbi:MAG: DUF1365 domain-containing protein [Moraxellaceae bacterium]
MSRPDWLYHGTVAHARLAPVTHRFRYPALFLCVPLSERARLRSRLFSLDRFNLFSLHVADHGDGGDPERWIRDVLRQHGLCAADGEVWLQTMPRVLGFVFNPVSFWYCHDRAGELRAVLCEVNNTFGERHCYLLTAPNNGVIGNDSELQARKVFHVSPFFAVQGEYRFRFMVSGARRTVCIDYHDEDAPVLKTVITGIPGTLDDRALVRAFLAFGWSTLMVVLRIHWQALKLWRKRVTFHRKPEPPLKEITR